MGRGFILLTMLLSAAIGLLTVPLCIRIGHRFDLLDRPGRHKRHKRPVPFLGGVALFLSVWLTVLVMSLVFHRTLADYTPVLPYVLAGAMIILLVGLSDDLQPVNPWVKLGAQVSAGLVLYLGGMRIEPVAVPFIGMVSNDGLTFLLTMLWVVGLTNAVNLIDGLDGLAGGVGLIAAGTMLVIGMLYAVSGVVLFASVLVGFLVVFLLFNRYPARIFLGDSGSLQLGYYFAVVSLLVPIKSFTAAALYLPLLTLGVPLLETVSSIVRRLLSGRQLMRADRRHLFHYLELLGLSPRRVVLVFYGCSLVFSGFTLAMYFWNRRLVFGLLVLFMVVILGAFFILLTTSSRLRRFGRMSRNGENRRMEQ